MCAACKWADTPTCVTDNELFLETQPFEELTIGCTVHAEPSDVHFYWEFNSSLAGDSANLRNEPLMAIANSGLRSELKFTPRSAEDYGTLYCYAQNRIGQQKKPCVYHIGKSGEYLVAVLDVRTQTRAISCLEKVLIVDLAHPYRSA